MLPSLIRILRPASPQSLPNFTKRRPAGRRACFSAARRVAGARAFPPPPENPPESVPVVTLPGDRRSVLVDEAPSDGEVLSPLQLLLYEFGVLASFPLKY